MGRETIKRYDGRIVGSIETLPNGDQIARDFYGKILGKYCKDQNVTKDFYGKIVARGNCVMGFINFNA